MGQIMRQAGPERYYSYVVTSIIESQCGTDSRTSVLVQRRIVSQLSSLFVRDHIILFRSQK